MKRIGNQVAPVAVQVRVGPISLDAMFGHLIADGAWIMIDNEVQRYVQELGDALSLHVYHDLLEED